MSSVTLNDLIELALRQKNCNRKAYNEQRFGTQAQRYCQTITNRFCADLPEDLHLDICQEAFTKLFGYEPEALERSSGKALFRRCIFVAIRAIYAAHAAPGVRSRKSRTKRQSHRVAAEHIGCLVDSDALARCTVVESDGVHIDFDLIPSQAAAIETKRVKDRFEVDSYLSMANSAVARALYLICVDGERIEFAAADVGISRFALNRQLAAFSSLCRSAA